MTKEDILGKTPIIADKAGNNLYVNRKYALNAMDEYAKQQAITFAVFRDLYHREERRKVKEEERRLGGMITWDYTPDGEIYNQFIESQNKQHGTH